MSREHLYKAKRVNWMELPKEEWWVEGNLLISDEDCYIIPDFGVSCIEKLNNYVCDKLITLHAFEVDKETVCEYTGLTGKNRRKIFEGDIVKIPYEHMEDNICKAIFRRGMFVGESIDGCEDSIIIAKGIMVIGNIFDNPELLEGV